MINVVAGVEKFFNYDIWHISKPISSKPKAIVVFYLRVLVLSIRGYIEDRIGIRASALTFFSLLSVVPILALGFGIAQGFGLRKVLHSQLQESLAGHEEVFIWIVNFADSMLKNAQSGWMAGAGILLLLWSVIKVLWNIENSFNYIWKVKRQRNFIRKLSDYISLIVVAPILIVLSGSISIFITTQFSRLANDNSLVDTIGPYIVFLINVSPFIIIWILLTLLYMVMPNKVVKFKSALFAAIIAGSVFQLLQWGYIHFQIGVSQYNAIYGSFAAFPLLLLFLQISWLIVLFGAEISYAHQNVTNYEYEKDIDGLSNYNKRLAYITVLHSIIKSFEKGENPKTITCLIEEFGAPIKLITQVVNVLKESGLIAESEIDGKTIYLPSSDIHKLDLNCAITKLNDSGAGKIRFQKDETLVRVDKKLQLLRKELKSSKQNILIKDI